MRKSRSLRTSLAVLVLVPSLALAAVWAAASDQLLSEGLDLRGNAQLGLKVAAGSNDLQRDMQTERRLSVAWLADPQASRTALDAQRAQTDALLQAETGYNLNAEPAHVRAALQPYFEAFARLQLPTLRQRIDQRQISAQDAANNYSAVLQSMLQSVRNLWQTQEGSLVTAAEPVSMLMFSTEDVQLEDTIVTGALPSGRLTADQRNAFVLDVGAQRALMIDAVRREPVADRAAMGKIVTSADWLTMVSVENDIINASTRAHGTVDLPASARKWRSALDGVSAMLDQRIQQRTAELINLQSATANRLLLDQGVVSLAGLLALLASLVLSWRVSRSLLRRMSGLREATLELAETRLPDVVARLNRGEQVDIETAAPPLDYGTDELGRMAQAFNAAQRTTISSAVALADSRRGFQKVILAVARHTQNLANRQLGLLDELERKHQESEVLEGLYQLDSQATQMRRYEENLVIIAGGQPGRRWSEPVAVADVLRSATGEVADYQRITVQADDGTWFVGHAVGDVIHLLAELMENATAYSPAVCPVWVRADLVGKGIAVEIEDRGIGMSAKEYEAINQRLANPPEFDVLALAEDARLGTFVVARLAAQHGISVTLRPSAFGGTSAVVLIPEKLVVRDASPAERGWESLMPDTPSEKRPPFGPAPAAFTPAPAAYDDSPQMASVTPLPSAASSPALAPAPAAPIAVAPAPAMPSLPAGSGAIGGSAGHEGQASPPPLPQRVPQASLVDELRQEPTAAEPVAAEPQPRTPERPPASALAAFQRGTRHARHAAPRGNGTPRSTAPAPTDAPKKDAPR